MTGTIPRWNRPFRKGGLVSLFGAEDLRYLICTKHLQELETALKGRFDPTGFK